MKAILFDQPGGHENLYYGTTSDPQPGPDELLVRVHATAVNRADILQRRGSYNPPPGASSILGLELAGEVIVPTGSWQVGDRVMAVVTGGGYAELAIVPVGMAIPIPPELSFEQAAAIPEAFLTAFLNLFVLTRAEQIRPHLADETVLIHAGASGVGTAAIQLACAAGARVIVTAGTEEKLAYCRDLGANLAINYHSESFVERVQEFTHGQGVQLILDFIGASYWNANLTALARHGRLMVIGFMGGSQGQLDIGPILMKSLTIGGTTLRRMSLSQKTALTEAFRIFALERFARGELKPAIDTIYPLNQVALAHQLVEANRTCGKIVLRVD